jgi:hypothetical protein
MLPDGETRVAFAEDVQEVDGTDADWLDLLAAELADDDLEGVEDE